MPVANMKEEYDVIIVGSGTCGAVLAKALSKHGKSVLILEKGGRAPQKESLGALISVADEVPVGKKLKTMRALAAGGSTNLYFAVAQTPPLEPFLKLGIDLGGVLEEARSELPLSILPDEMLGEQVLKLRQSAWELGYDWKKNHMLIDTAKCPSGYAPEAKWKALAYLNEAVNHGATLVNRAAVTQVVTHKNKASGVIFKTRRKPFGSTIRQVRAEKIVLAAGSLATPLILRDSGIGNIEKNGFFCEPGFAMFGFVPELNGRESFMGSMSTDYDDGIAMGDVNLSRLFYKMMMVGGFRLTRLFSYNKCIGVGVKVKDGLAGEILENGRYHKELTLEEQQKLKKGEALSIEILKRAGAKQIFNSGVSAGLVGGVVRIRKDVDAGLQTEVQNLYVCDGSILPVDVRVTPVMTLICLAKYLANRLISEP